jgi:hypothetical protein
VGSRGLGPFVTREVFRRRDGSQFVWESRWHRKHPTGAPATHTWWAPRAIAWWIGVLFAIGSACFAIGSCPPYATRVGTDADNLTFFIGSIFFTTAAFLQYHEAASARLTLTGPSGPHRRRLRALFRLQHHRIDWWASLIQFVGTLWFNRTTFSAWVIGLGATTDHHPVWRPDALGSVCFLVSSWLAWAEECHGPFAWRPRQLSWWITLLNLVGSVAFGVSAVASYVKPNGELVSLVWTNLGTFVGAVCFLAGALLLLPERTAGVPPAEPALRTSDPRSARAA